MIIALFAELKFRDFSGGGAKQKLTDQQVSEMRKKRATGVLIKDLMAEYGLSKASV